MKLAVILAAFSLVGCVHNPAVTRNTAVQLEALTKQANLAAELRRHLHYAR